MGKFLQTDPIGYGDGMNTYTYGRGDPINGTDSSGTVTFDPFSGNCGVGASSQQCWGQDDWPSGPSTGFFEIWTHEERFESTSYNPGAGQPYGPVRDPVICKEMGGHIWPTDGECHIDPPEKCAPYTGPTFSVATPTGNVNMPAPSANGGNLTFVGVEGSASAGFGASGSSGSFTYTGADGNLYGGYYASTGLAMGAGAGASAQMGGFSNAEGFFGNGAFISFQIGPVAVSVFVAGDFSSGGVSGGGGVSAGEVVLGSTYTVPDVWCIGKQSFIAKGY